jgi:cytoskeletal protein RodZ
MQDPQSQALTPEAKEALAQTQMDLGVEALAGDIRQSQQLLARGRETEAERLDQRTASRLRDLASRLEKHKQDVVNDRLERLAATQAEAEARKRELDQASPEQSADRSNATAPPRQGPPQDSGSQGGEAATAQRLNELAEDLAELRDAELARLAQKLHQQAGPQNVAGTRSMGLLVPAKTISDGTLTPAIGRLRDLITELVRYQLLVDRDERVPDEYKALVERYFKALSDDLRE